MEDVEDGVVFVVVLSDLSFLVGGPLVSDDVVLVVLRAGEVSFLLRLFLLSASSFIVGCERNSFYINYNEIRI